MQRRHHDCRTSTAALSTTRCYEVGHMAGSNASEGQAVWQPGALGLKSSSLSILHHHHPYLQYFNCYLPWVTGLVASPELLDWLSPLSCWIACLPWVTVLVASPCPCPLFAVVLTQLSCNVHRHFHLFCCCRRFLLSSFFWGGGVGGGGGRGQLFMWYFKILQSQ